MATIDPEIYTQLSKLTASFPSRKRGLPWMVSALLVILPLVLLWVVAQISVTEYVRSTLIPMVNKRYDLNMKVGGISLGVGKIYLEHVSIRKDALANKDPGIRIGKITIAISSLPIGKKYVFDRVDLDGLNLRLIRDKNGQFNIEQLLTAKRLPGIKSAKTPAPQLAFAKINGIYIKSANIQVVDETHDLRINLRSLSSYISLKNSATLSFTHDKLFDSFKQVRFSLPTFTVHSDSQPEDSPLHQALSLGGLYSLKGVISGDDKDKNSLLIRLSGGANSSRHPLWRATASVDKSFYKGSVDFNIERKSLRTYSRLLKNTPIVKPERTTIATRVQAQFDRQMVQFNGSFDTDKLNIFHPKISKETLDNITAKGRFNGLFNWKRQSLDLRALEVTSKGVDLRGNLVIGRIFSDPLIQAQMKMPATSCQTILDALPRGLIPAIHDFKLEGIATADVSVSVNYRDLDKTRLRGGLRAAGCKVIRANEKMDYRRLLGSFTHQVEPYPDDDLSFVVGPPDPYFVPYARIPRHVVGSILATEDAGFFEHRGFISSAFSEALANNLKKGGFAVGASTISMQMVKNVLLSQQRTLSRKFQELFLTWYVEQHISKRRIMEIYLNVIEFGPGIYGIDRAAEHFFGKRTEQITPLEAAYLASIVPSPKRYYIYYCQNGLSNGWERFVKRIVNLAAAQGYVNGYARSRAMSEKLDFRRNTETLGIAECRHRIQKLTYSWQREHKRRLTQMIKREAPSRIEFYSNLLSI